MSTIQKHVELEAWQEHFDFALPRKELLRADEVATALGCDDRTVMRLFDTGELMGHDVNTRGRVRQQIRFRRDSVILLLARRANYAPVDLRCRIIEVLAKQSRGELVSLQQSISELLRRKA